MWLWPRESSSEVLSSQSYRCSSGIPEICRHWKSLLCSCWWDNPDNPVLGRAREYCHNSYNGCFSKVEVHDFRRFLGYVLTDGYSLDVGIVSLGEIYCFPCIPNTWLHNQKVSGVYRWDSSSSSISSRRYLVCDWVILTTYLFQLYLAYFIHQSLIMWLLTLMDVWY